MKVSSVYFLLAALALPYQTSLAAISSAQSQLQPLFESRYAAMKSAMAQHDAKAIAKLLTPDFVSEDISGSTQTASQMIDEVLALPPDPSKVSETTITSVRAESDAAIVTQRYHMTKVTSQPNESAKHKVELVTVSTDTWIQIDDIWRLQRTVTKSLDYTVDGQTMLHKVHGGATSGGAYNNSSRPPRVGLAH